MLRQMISLARSAVWKTISCCDWRQMCRCQYPYSPNNKAMLPTTQTVNFVARLWVNRRIGVRHHPRTGWIQQPGISPGNPSPARFDPARAKYMSRHFDLRTGNGTTLRVGIVLRYFRVHCPRPPSSALPRAQRLISLEHLQVAHRQGEAEESHPHNRECYRDFRPLRKIVRVGRVLEAGNRDVKAVKQKARNHQDGNREQAVAVFSHATNKQEEQRKHQSQHNFKRE